MCDRFFVAPCRSQAGQPCAWGHQSLWGKPCPHEIGMSVMSPPAPRSQHVSPPLASQETAAFEVLLGWTYLMLFRTE